MSKLTLSQWMQRNHKSLKISYRRARRAHQLAGQEFDSWVRDLYRAYVEYA